MVQNRVDFQFYESEADFPDYGNWFVGEMKGNSPCYEGDSNVSKLPCGGKIPRGASAITKDNGDVYCNNGKTGTTADWVKMID